MAESFLVIGAGGHAKVVIDALIGSGCRVLACYDDNAELIGKEPLPGVPVIGNLRQIALDGIKGRRVIVAIGDNTVRRKIADRFDLPYGIAVASSAVLGTGVRVGEGSMILPSATVNVDTLIGRHAILNTSCSVDHDCRIGDFAHIAPGCHLGGNVTVGEGTLLGIGTNAIPGVRIGRWSVIGTSAVVTKDIPDNCTAVGVPAKVIKSREEGWHLK